MVERRGELARISTEEMGMLFTDALSDIDKAIANINYFIISSESLLASKKCTKWVIIYEPLGTILVIAPWNFPFNQGFRNIIPQLMAGNSILLKHASNLPRVSLAIQSLFDDSGIPLGVFRTLLMEGKEMEKLIIDRRVSGVSITAGDIAGRAVGMAAWGSLKPTVLELGGNDACIVLPDATVGHSIPIIVRWRMANGGQKCNAIKRLILIGERADLIEALKLSFESFVPWDPFDPLTTLPPLVNAASVADIAHKVDMAVSDGAYILTGGDMITLWDVSKPQFYRPTILMDVSKENSAYDLEFFGPVLTIYQASDIEEAIAIANDSQYWLGCVILGNDKALLDQCAREIRVGNISFNAPVTSYPDLPYGWIKNSGYWRELGEVGIKAFMNIKTIVW